MLLVGLSGRATLGEKEEVVDGSTGYYDEGVQNNKLHFKFKNIYKLLSKS